MSLIWKFANICPLAKVKPTTMLQKHIRPISLTPVLSKILESFICQWVMDTIKEDTDPQQYGSIKGSSTCSAPTGGTGAPLAGSSGTPPVGFSMCCCWTSARHSTKWTIPPFYGNCLLPAYLSASLAGSHCSFVSISSVLRLGTVYLSDWSIVHAGVPQGTLFGQMGFIIYINDLHTCFPTCKYMDDCTLWEVCSTDAADSQLQHTAIEAVQ